jgi:hypothetical protein
MTWIGRSICTVAAVTWLVGCGGSEVPAKQLADTEASIRAARELGAEDTPKAALQLKIAEDGLQRAQALSADDEQEAARLALQEAEADAELAVLLAKQEKVEASASQAKSRAESMDQAKDMDQAKEQAPKDAP